MKQCSKCEFQGIKGIDFPKTGTICKSCHKIRKDAWYKANSDRIAVAKKAKYELLDKTTLCSKRRESYWENREKNLQQQRKSIFTHRDVISARRKRYYMQNKEQSNASSKKYRIEHPRQYKDMMLRRNYGIGIDDYETMLKNQNGQCKICGATDVQTKGHNYFHVDHDHVTGKVRGLLCSVCNKGLGSFRDSQELLHKAAEYLKENS